MLPNTSLTSIEPVLALDANTLSAHYANVKAALLIADRFVYGDGTFAEVRVWQVPSPVPPSDHDFKYRLVYIVDGERVIGFDNERGKGDHWHIDGVERAYQFRGIDVLLGDLIAEVAKWRHRHGRR